jgi:hypothetical protein
VNLGSSTTRIFGAGLLRFARRALRFPDIV